MYFRRRNINKVRQVKLLFSHVPFIFKSNSETALKSVDF